MKKSRYALPYEAWMVLFILVPILIVLYYACTTSQGGRVAFSLANLAQVFSPTYLSVLWRSLWIALVATVICLLIGYPVASILASRHFKRSSLMLMLIIIPMWMNFLLRTYAWINLLDTNGLIARLLSLFGLGNVSLLYNTFAVIIGLVYNFLPFMVLPIYTILSKMEPQLIEAAEDLGANSFQVFRKVKLPLSMPGIVSGITMVFIPATTTFAVSRLLGGGQVMMYGELIENQFLFTRNWHFGAALSLVMMVLVLISMWLFKRNDGSSAEGGMLL